MPERRGCFRRSNLVSHMSARKSLNDNKIGVPIFTFPGAPEFSRHRANSSNALICEVATLRQTDGIHVLQIPKPASWS